MFEVIIWLFIIGFVMFLLSIPVLIIMGLTVGYKGMGLFLDKVSRK